MFQRMNYAAAAPGGVKALGTVYGYVAQSGLPPALVELVYLRISQINGCAYCIDMHSRELLKSQVSVEKLALVPVWEEAAGLFNSHEQAALKWAEIVTRVSETHVPDEAYRQARSAFGEKELVDLTIAIGLMNAFNRLAISFRATPAAAVSPA
jgi:AhpD family alkylhydroperoxidase